MLLDPVELETRSIDSPCTAPDQAGRDEHIIAAESNDALGGDSRSDPPSQKPLL